MAGSDWSVAFCFNPTTLNIFQMMIGTFDTTGTTKRFYVLINGGSLVLQIGTGVQVTVSTTGFCSAGTSYTLMLSYSSSTGIVTSKIRNMATGIVTNLADYTVVGLAEMNDNSLGIFNNSNGAANSFLGKIWNLRVWFSQQSFTNMADCNYGTGANLFLPLNGSLQDISGNNYHATQAGGTNVVFNRDDYSGFRNDEYGFAVKSGKIYPKNLAGTGYAGLVGDPDAVYQGLIALNGQIEVAGQGYLKTLFDFEQTVNTEIENAGLILDDYTALDCNDDLIYTADPYLAPLTYPNAFTAMTLANVSQQRYSDLADNNASRRIFIKYGRGTDVTDDGSRALITAGTIMEILVYKRDLSVAEAIRVLKYCADMPMDNQVMIGDEPTLDASDNFIYTCTGHTEPEIEIEEP